jgi:hypothetical protein
MGKTYALADNGVLSLLARVRRKYHSRLDDHGVAIGVLMVFAPLDEDGEKNGTALKGYAGAAAGASVGVVPLKDRLTKNFDVEILIDGDAWEDMTEQQRCALLDHELTHIEPTGDLDSLDRPVIKMRKEGFVLWGFYEIMERWGPASAEAQGAKALINKCQLLGLDGLEAAPVPESAEV